jgi:hypothetical protein
MHHNISIQYDQQDTLFAFSLLCLTASTCFEHLFVHYQEVMCIQQLVYFVCIITIVVYTVPPDDEQVSARNM